MLHLLKRKFVAKGKIRVTVCYSKVCKKREANNEIKFERFEYAKRIPRVIKLLLVIELNCSKAKRTK